ncbi:MAG: DUF3108 domain-containing protein [Chromatiaceae bacterium]
MKTHRLAAGLALSLLLGCTPLPQTLSQPMAVEATYRLVFNEQLVGMALFALQIHADGSYELEAFTTPAGKMRRAKGQEVLEISRGTIDDAGIRPQRFEHSVMQDEDIEVVELQFDWDGHALQLRGRNGTQRVALLPGTHDRLSYLLAANRLAASSGGAQSIKIAALESTEEVRLEIAGEETVTVPLGTYPASRVRRTAPAVEEERLLWFDTALSPLPLRVLHEANGNRVEMQLESLSGRPSGPR